MATLTTNTAAALLRGNLHKHNRGRAAALRGTSGKENLSESLNDLLEIKAQKPKDIYGDRDKMSDDVLVGNERDVDLDVEPGHDMESGHMVMHDVDVGSREVSHYNGEESFLFRHSKSSVNNPASAKKQTTCVGSVSNLTKAQTPTRAETLFRRLQKLRPDKVANHIAMLIKNKKRVYLDESILSSVDEADEQQRIASQMKYFVISVTDNGVGIAPEDVTKVFHSVVQFKYVYLLLACVISCCLECLLYHWFLL